MYRLHAEHVVKANNEKITKTLRDLEEGCLTEISQVIKRYEAGNKTLDDLDNLMKGCVETEIKLYG